MVSTLDNITNMKTTIDIADPLLEQVRKLAARERTTVDGLVERGLRREVRDSVRSTAFRMRKATFKGDGLQPGSDGTPWECVRALIYERPVRSSSRPGRQVAPTQLPGTDGPESE